MRTLAPRLIYSLHLWVIFTLIFSLWLPILPALAASNRNIPAALPSRVETLVNNIPTSQVPALPPFSQPFDSNQGQLLPEPDLTASLAQSPSEISQNSASAAPVAQASAASNLLFIENVGQFDAKARFMVRGLNGTLYLAEDSLWLTLIEQLPPDRSGRGRRVGVDQANQHRRGVHLKFSFPGANPQARLEPFNRLSTRVSYFVGNDSRQWRSDVPAWGGVRYVDFYPGADLELTAGPAGQLLQRLVIHPEATVKLDEVRLQIKGVDDLSLNGDYVRLQTRVADFDWPLLQVITANSPAVQIPLPRLENKEIIAPFVQLSTALSPATAPGRTHLGLAAPLPLGLIPHLQGNSNGLLYGTYLGGSSEEYGYGIAVDETSNAYVVGRTFSTNFPTTSGAFDTSLEGNEDGFVIKLNASGTQLDYATFIGGSEVDQATDIVIDQLGNAYITGFTTTDFPTTLDAIDQSFNGSADIFVVKLNSTGTELNYGTFFGGSENDIPYSIAIDEAGSIYLTGQTSSTEFPITPNAPDDDYDGVNGDGFVVKITLGEAEADYATFLGGNDYFDSGYDIVVDEAGNAYVVGDTSAADFPTTSGAFDTSYNGVSDAFVVIVNPSGTQFDYGTFLGGDGIDAGYSIAIDETERVYITGDAFSTDFPTKPGSFNSTSDNQGGFVTRFNADGTDLDYVALIKDGGALDIAIDAGDRAYLTGVASSDSFTPTSDAFDTTHNGNSDAFVAILNAAGAQLDYATFLGGTADDDGRALAIDILGNAYITGNTHSTDFPTTPGAYDGSYSDTDVFIAKLAIGSTSLYTDSTLASECPICTPQDTTNFFGGPINTHSGNYGYQTTDLSIPTLGQPLRFERTYNSLPVTGTVIYDRPLGYGWTHNYNLSLTLPDDIGGEPGLVILKAFHGSRLRFSDNGDGSYSPVPGVFGTLTRQGSSAPYQYVLTATNQNVYTFGLLTDSLAIEPIYTTPPISLTLAPNYAVGVAPGQIFSLTHTLTNTSGVTDTYDIAAASAGNWVTVAPLTATLAPNQAITVTAILTTPQSYGRDTTITATVTAASQGTPSIMATAVETLTLRGYRLLTQRDPQGNETQFDYDSAGSLARASDPSGQRYLEFDYDGQGRLASVRDHANRTVSYGYDLYDNLAVVTDTRNLTWSYVYTSPPPHTGTPHLLSQVIDPDGRTVEKTFFDSAGRAIRQEDGLGNVVGAITYVSATTRVITEAGKVYTDTYDARNLLVQQENSLGEEENYGFDTSFNRDFTEDGNNNETHYLRDEFGRTLVITDANGITTTFTYSGSTTNILTTRDGRGNTTAYSYDGNNLKTTTNPLNGTTVYTYNTTGQVTATKDENGNVTQYGYDSLGNRTVITDALNNLTRYQYDSLGWVITTTDAQNKITVNQYDAADHLIQITENYAAGQGQNYQNTYNLITRYGYDGAGRQTVITDTLNRVSRNIYDDAGRLEETVENYVTGSYNPNIPDQDIVTTYEYDQYGRPVTTTDTLGHLSVTIYDEVGRVHRSIANFEDGNYDSNQPDEDIITEYLYDSNGNVVETIELPGETEERRTCTVYDNLNRVERTLVNCVTGTPETPGSYSSDPAEDLVTRYVYDAVGNQIQIIDPLTRTTSYSYDALNRVITMTNPAGDFTTYGYDAASNRTRVTDANQHNTFYAYDKLNRVMTTTDHLNGQAIVRYDAVGNRTQTIDAENRVTTYTYDSIYRLTQLTDAENQETLYSYDALGNKLTETDAESMITRFEYDRLNRLITTTQNYDSGGPIDFETNVKTVVTYNGLGWRTRVTDGRGKSTQYGYDGLGRTLVITDALAHTTEYSYDGHGNRRSVTNGEDETTEFGYDGVDRLSLISDPLANETEYHYNKAGERTRLIDAEAVETRYGYDILGRLISVTENYQNGGPVDEQTNVLTQYGYDKVGNRTVITDARGYPTTYEYDALNRRIELTNALGHQTQYAYDKVGNQKVLTDANTLGGLGGAVTQFDYDNLNRLLEIDYSDSTPDVTFTYDNVGNRETMADGTGITTYLYDKLYRLSSVTDGNSQTVGYGHDEVGNRTELSYPGSQQVSYDYDDANRLDTVTADWLNGQFGYNYDDANRLTGLMLPNEVTSGYSYDPAGRLKLLTHTLEITPLASYAYALDKVGNRRVLTESLVAISTQGGGAYLESGGLVVMEAEHYVISTTTASHQWQLQTGQSGYTGTGYLQPLPDLDALYQTTELANSPRVDYPIYFTTPGTYTLWLRGYPANAAGDSLHIGLNGVITTVTGFGPEEWGWSSQTTNSQPFTVAVTSADLYTVSLWLREDGLRIDQLALTTDTNYVPSGFLAETERLSTGEVGTPALLTRTIVYTYDKLYRLTQAEYTTGESYQYAYDEVGNRLQQIIDGDTTTYIYDDANRLASVTHLSATQPYTFDRNGNLLNTGVMTNTFDGTNRLVSSSRSTSTVQPIYNGAGDRVRQVVSGTTTYYTLDVEGLPEVITSSGEIYLHLPGVIVTEKAGQVRYLLGDGLGSIRQAIDGTGAVVAYNEYDPYGNPVQEGSQPYGFTGEWWQDEVDLLHLRARWYAPEAGIFMSRDPVESEPPYQYVRGNPINLTDPAGNLPNCTEDDCPLTQPSPMHEKARISCFDLYTIGGSNPMERYLEKESYSDPEALLTRVAMTENQTNLEDRRLVMWVVRYRMEIAHSIGANSTAEQSRPTSLWQEVSRGGFHAMDIIRKIENTEKVALERLGDNVNAGFYPSNTALRDDEKSVKDWITTYYVAQTVLATPFKDGFPDLLKRYKNNDPMSEFLYANDSFHGKFYDDGIQEYNQVLGENKYFSAYPQRTKWVWPEAKGVLERDLEE